jgi:hypothetical protein
MSREALLMQTKPRKAYATDFLCFDLLLKGKKKSKQTLNLGGER